MNEENITPGGSCCGGTSGNEYVCKAKCAVNKAVAVAKDPKNIWESIKSEPATIQDLYKNYICWVAAIPALGQLIGGLFYGRFPLGLALITYIGALLAVFVSSFVMKYVAPKFGGTADQVSTLKLVAYAQAPAWLAGVLYVLPIPGVAGLLVLIASLYGIYVFWNGITPVIEVPAEKRAVFILVMIVVWIVISVLLGLLFAPFIIADAARQGMGTM